MAVEPGLPFVPADPILLDQVMANLIGNATRYAGPAARIVLQASADSGAIVLSVTDDGPGIRPEVLPHVFEKFVRAPRSGGDAGEGSGLGLAIAKGIVDAHRGAIAVTSPDANGRGTKFEIRLPMRGEAAMSGSMRVLVVDDEPAIHRFLTPALVANDYQVLARGHRR